MDEASHFIEYRSIPNWFRSRSVSAIQLNSSRYPADRQVYTVFIAENLQAFILAVTDCQTFIATKWLIAAQLIVFMPLAMIRNLAKLSGTALVADVFILIGSKSSPIIF